MFRSVVQFKLNLQQILILELRTHVHVARDGHVFCHGIHTYVSEYTLHVAQKWCPNTCGSSSHEENIASFSCTLYPPTFHLSCEHKHPGICNLPSWSRGTDGELIEGARLERSEGQGEGGGVHALHRQGGSKLCVVNEVDPGVKGTCT